MTVEDGEVTPRRGFLRAVMRGVGLTALAGIALATGSRSRTPGLRTESSRARCGRCPVLVVCGRPDALEVRDARGVPQDLKKLGRVDSADRLCEKTAGNRSSSIIES